MSTRTGTGHLVRLILRRDRIRLPIWIGAITAITAASAAAVKDLYDTPAKIATYEATVTSSAAGKMLNGTPYGVDRIGGIVAYEATTTAVVVTALMTIFLVVRHTRGEEETGRAELVRSTVTGRHAATTAVVVVSVAASLLVGVLDAIVLTSAGLGTTGSLLHGATLAGIGCVFTGVAASAAQVPSGARAALGLAGIVLATAFVLNGIGAVSDNWLGWLSPFGWAQKVQPFGDTALLPLALLALTTVGGFSLAAYLNSHRDEGAGLVQPRLGSARAAESLGTPFGFALRQQRGLIWGWAVGLLLGAVLFGAVGNEVLGMVRDNPELGKVFSAGGSSAAGAVLDSYFAYALTFLAVISSAFVVSSALRLRAEEDAGRAEALLATAMSRTRWAIGGLAVTLLFALVNLVLIGIGIGLAHAVVSGDSSLIGPILGGALAQAPACLAVASVAVLVFGWLPRWTALGWTAFAVAILVAYLGDLLGLPDVVSGLSPFWHLPAVPQEPFTPGPAAWTGLVALVLGAVGLVGLRRRDLG